MTLPEIACIAAIFQAMLIVVQCLPGKGPIPSPGGDLLSAMCLTGAVVLMFGGKIPDNSLPAPTVQVAAQVP